MPMLIPAIVPHFFVAVPRKIFQEIGRAIQSKGQGARLRYKELDPAAIVFHKNGFQYAANLRCGAGEEKCVSLGTSLRIKPMLKEAKEDASLPQLSPLKPAPWDVKTGCETPSARLNKVFDSMLPTLAVLDQPVPLKPKPPAIPPRIGSLAYKEKPKLPAIPPRTAAAHIEKPTLPPIPPRTGAVVSQANVPAPRSISLPR